jgi:hypothetical protein
VKEYQSRNDFAPLDLFAAPTRARQRPGDEPRRRAEPRHAHDRRAG